MESPPRKRRKVLIGKGPFALVLVLIGALGLLGGFFTALFLDPLSIHFRESTFSPDSGLRVVKGRDFDAKAELRRLSDADREKYLAAMSQAKAGDAQGALAAFTSLTEGGRDFALAHGQIALLRMRAMRGNLQDSLAAADAVASGLQAAKGLPWMEYVAGLFFENSGRPDSAEAHYKAARSASPQFAYPYVGLGRLQLAKGEIGRAETSFRIAIALMETSPEAYRSSGERAIPVTEAAPFDWLADLYYQKGADDSALMALEYGLEKGWRTNRMSLVQGRLWEARGFLGKADSAYRRLLAKEPDNSEYAEALATLGWKPVRGGEGAAGAVFAISLLDPLARQNPRDVPLWMALGQAYYHRGLYGMATECFDSSLKYEPAYPGLAARRNAAYEALMRESRKTPVTSVSPGAEARKTAKPPRAGDGASEEQTPVVIPGSIALLGTYSVPWGSSQAAVRGAYPKKDFRTLPNGDLMDVFMSEGVRHEYLLAFREGKLWGMRIFVSDSAGVGGDLFGRMIRTKTKISGEGKGTGETLCQGSRGFQGVIWENDDTFEFMAQFDGRQNEVRLVRMGRDYLPAKRRLCDLVPYLNAEKWR
jgi:tetratricopeptide (TPR) repeat protein